MKIQSLIKAIAAVIILSGGTGCTTNKGPASSAAVEAGITYSESFLVDVRTPEEFASGTAEGSVNIPLNEVESRLKEFEGKKQVVVFCRSGGRSTEAFNILRQNGITNVVNGGTWGNVAEILKEEKAGK